MSCWLFHHVRPVISPVTLLAMPGSPPGHHLLLRRQYRVNNVRFHRNFQYGAQYFHLLRCSFAIISRCRIPSPSVICLSPRVCCHHIFTDYHHGLHTMLTFTPSHNISRAISSFSPRHRHYYASPLFVDINFHFSAAQYHTVINTSCWYFAHVTINNTPTAIDWELARLHAPGHDIISASSCQPHYHAFAAQSLSWQPIILLLLLIRLSSSIPPSATLFHSSTVTVNYYYGSLLMPTPLVWFSLGQCHVTVVSHVICYIAHCH